MIKLNIYNKSLNTIEKVKINFIYINDILFINKIMEHILLIYIFFLEIINNFMPVYDIVFLINIVYKYNGLV